MPDRTESSAAPRWYGSNDWPIWDWLGPILLLVTAAILLAVKLL